MAAKMSRAEFLKSAALGAAAFGATATIASRVTKALDTSWRPDIELIGTGDPETDLNMVQRAVDGLWPNGAEISGFSGKIRLKGTFSFGTADPDSKRFGGAVYLNLPIQYDIRGSMEGARIIGGCNSFSVGLWPQGWEGTGRPAKAGFRDLGFEGPLASAILAAGECSLEVRGCSFIDPVRLGSGGPAICRVIDALGASGAGGDIRVYDNYFSGQGMLNAITVGGNHAQVGIGGNEIEGACLSGIAVDGSDAMVSGNYIMCEDTGSPSAGIFICAAGTGTSVITNNEIDAVGRGILLSSADGTIVMRNGIHIESSLREGGSGICLHRCSSCQVGQNTISGSAFSGVSILGDALRPSTGNTVYANNTLRLEAAASYYLDRFSYGNSVTGFSSDLIDMTDPNPENDVYEGENSIVGCAQAGMARPRPQDSAEQDIEVLRGSII